MGCGRYEFGFRARQSADRWCRELPRRIATVAIAATIGGIATSAMTASAQPLSSGVKVQWQLVASLPPGAGDGPLAEVTALGTPILERDQVLFEAWKGEGKAGVLRFRRASGSMEWVLEPGEIVAGLGSPVAGLASGPSKYQPTIGADKGRAALVVELQGFAAHALLVEKGTGFAEVARFGGAFATEVPGPWPALGQLGWTAPPQVAGLFAVVPGPYGFASEPVVPTLWKGRALFSAPHEGRLISTTGAIDPGEVGLGIERALVRTLPDSTQLLKLADPWFPETVATTPAGLPYLRSTFGGHAGEGAVVWRDRATAQSSDSSGLLSEERVRLSGQGAAQTLALARVKGGAPDGAFTPGQPLWQLMRFGGESEPWMPVVNPAGTFGAWWAQSGRLVGPTDNKTLQTMMGIYRRPIPTGVPFHLVDTTMVVAGAPGKKYDWISGPSAWGNRTVVTARYPGAAGPVYDVLAIDGAKILRVAATGTTVDGKAVKSLRTSQMAQYLNTVALWADFEDGSQGIWLATVTPPCPADLTGSSDPLSPKYGVPDGWRNRDDLLYYEAQYAAKKPAADVTSTLLPSSPFWGVPDGNISIVDLLWFRHHYYVLGCQ